MLYRLRAGKRSCMDLTVGGARSPGDNPYKPEPSFSSSNRIALCTLCDTLDSGSVFSSFARRLLNRTSWRTVGSIADQCNERIYLTHHYAAL